MLWPSYGLAVSRALSNLASTSEIEVSGRSTSTSKLPDPVDLSNVPEEYPEFADVFDKAKAQTLAPHRSYDLKINLKEGYTPPLGQVYLLSVRTRNPTVRFPKS